LGNEYWLKQSVDNEEVLPLQRAVIALPLYAGKMDEIHATMAQYAKDNREREELDRRKVMMPIVASYPMQ
jgi:hypothetical protein